MFDINELLEKFRHSDIVIVGNGESGIHWHPGEDDKRYIWTVENGLFHTPQACMTWMMNDLNGPALQAVVDREVFIGQIKECKIPIMTCRHYDEFPATVEYPLKEVLEDAKGLGYFADTFCYMLALCKLLEVKSIEMHGVEYFVQDMRNERACTEFWLGRLFDTGVNIRLNESSNLLRLPPIDGVNRHINGFYGYVEEGFPLRQASRGSVQEVPGARERVER